MKARWICATVVGVIALCAGVAVTQVSQADETLARESGCFECHGMDERGIGPSFREIAARYRDDDTARAALIEIVKNGGRYNWTEISRGFAMPPYWGRLSDAEIERLVDWVLSL